MKILFFFLIIILSTVSMYSADLKKNSVSNDTVVIDEKIIEINVNEVIFPISWRKMKDTAFVSQDTVIAIGTSGFTKFGSDIVVKASSDASKEVMKLFKHARGLMENKKIMDTHLDSAKKEFRILIKVAVKDIH